MDANHKAAWVDGLRSGKYERSYGLMFTRDGAVCALGVAYAVQGVTEEQYYAATVPPLGIPDAVRKTVIALNDSEATWNEIADYIEARVPATDISVFERLLEPRELVTGDEQHE